VELFRLSRENGIIMGIGTESPQVALYPIYRTLENIIFDESYEATSRLMYKSLAKLIPIYGSHIATIEHIYLRHPVNVSQQSLHYDS